MSARLGTRLSTSNSATRGILPLFTNLGRDVACTGHEAADESVFNCIRALMSSPSEQNGLFSLTTQYRQNRSGDGDSMKAAPNFRLNASNSLHDENLAGGNCPAAHSSGKAHSASSAVRNRARKLESSIRAHSSSCNPNRNDQW